MTDQAPNPLAFRVLDIGELIDADDVTIASFHPADEDVAAWEARAKAIDAHPDLVAALEATLPVLEAVRRSLAGLARARGLTGDGGPLLDQIKAALAKAGAR